MNMEEIEEIYNSYLNGQNKQMVSQIMEYEFHTNESFWDGLDDYIREWNPVLKYRTLKDIVSIYMKLEK